MTAEQPQPIEIFYSYAHKDEKLRNELEKHLYNLKRQGLITNWYDRDISAGTDWEYEIDMHLNTAGIILLLISPDFIASDYCSSNEMAQALQRHETGNARVIPIILRPTDYKGMLFSKLQALPTNARPVMKWTNRDEAFLDVARGIRKAVKELQLLVSPSEVLTTSTGNLSAMRQEEQSHLSDLTPVWNVPYSPNPRFTGREEILQHIHESFTRDTASSFKQPLALSGLGGMGKTQIALKYAYCYREEYQVVLWAKADSQEVFTSELVSFATLLKLLGQHEQDQQYALAAVKRWLEVHANWLLILDNIEDLTLVRDYLPTTTRGHILLTTNSQIMHGIARRLDIDKMETEEGVLLLLRRIGLLDADAPLERASEQERIQATAIITTLGGYPLAIDQAGAFIEENGANLQRYPELYARRRTHLLQTRGSIIADHPEPVATTLSLSFEKVEQASQAALELLYCLTFLDPDTIPDTLLELCASQLNEQLEAVVSDTFEFEVAVGELRKYSLVRRNPDGATLTIHRLVQDVLKESIDESTQRQWAERVVRAVSQAFPTEEFAHWETSRQYLPQAQNCSALIEIWHFAFPEAAQLLYKAGRYLDEQGQYPAATALIKQSLTIREQTVETQHHEMAESVNELAELYIKQGMYREAEPLLKRTLAIREQVLGPNHPDTTRSLNNLAVLYNNQGRYIEAEPLFKRALAIQEQALGPNHPDTATSLGDLAALYQAQGRYIEAEPLYKRALAIREQMLGPNHPYTATSFNNLATLYQAQGRYIEAEPLYKRALAIYEQTFGPEHPDIVITLGNYVQLLKATNRKGRAAEMEARMNILRRNISKRKRRSVSHEQDDF